MRIITATFNEQIELGKQGENLVTEVHFDVTGWAEEYGAGGVFSLSNRRNGDPAGYPVEITLEGDVVKWLVKAEDLAHAGCGVCELTYTVGEAVSKSVMFGTIVKQSLDGSGDPPDPWVPFWEQVKEARDEAVEAAGEAAQSERDAADSAGAASDSAEAASGSAASAKADALKAEGFAVGEQNGQPVESGSPYHENNAKYYKEQAAALAEEIEHSIDDIEALIPNQASPENQLADKNFVNSSIATNTANYISDDGQPFTSVAALEAYSGTVTNNDYAFVTGVDSDGNTYYDRYKATVVGGVVSWAKEYRLNNSSFTAAQWAAIESGITSTLVASYSAHLADTNNPHAVTKAQVGLGNVDNTPDSQKPISDAQAAALALKADKVVDAVAGDFAALDANGNLTDSGISKEISEQLEGELVSFKAAYAVPLKALSVALSPIQDLNGYASPWPAGGGKNKLPLVLDTIKSLNTGGLWSGNSYVLNGITFTVQTDNAGNVIGISTSGTATGTTVFLLTANIYTALVSGSYYLSGCTSDDASKWKLDILDNNGTPIVINTNGDTSFNVDSTLRAVRVVVYNGVNMSGITILPIIRLSSVADATFAPYSNICPIFGHTEVEITQTGKNLFAQPDGTNTFSGVTEKWENGILTLKASNATGEISSLSANWKDAGYCTLPAGSYKVKVTKGDETSSGSVSLALRDYDSEDTVASGLWGGTEVAMTLTKATKVYVAFYLYQFLSTGGKTVNVSVVRSSDSVDYEKSNVKKVLFDIGINQWDEVWEAGGINDTTGEDAAASGQFRSVGFISCASDTTYYVACKVSTTSIYVYFYDANQTFVSRAQYSGGYNVSNREVTTPSNGAFMRFKVQQSGGSATYNDDISINYPARFKDYYAHTGRGMVYSGTLDVLTGVLTITGVKDSFAWADGTSATVVGDYTRKSFTLSLSARIILLTSNIGPFMQGQTTNPVPHVDYSTSKVVRAYLPTTTDSATVIEFYYLLVTPTEIQLTPAQVETLVGINNVYADNGPITLERWKGLGEIIAAVHEALCA